MNSVGLGEVSELKITSVVLTDNSLFGSPIILLGMNEVMDIKYHEPMGEGDKHFVDLKFLNGTTLRCFNVVNIGFNPITKE